ncbi:down syndrome cell adhesion molecule-like protein Dscam2, partial [Caerostris extrusa]
KRSPHHITFPSNPPLQPPNTPPNSSISTLHDSDGCWCTTPYGTCTSRARTSVHRLAPHRLAHKHANPILLRNRLPCNNYLGSGPTHQSSYLASRTKSLILAIQSPSDASPRAIHYPKITWTADGENIPSSTRLRLGDFVTQDGSVVHSFLNISSVEVGDGKEYACNAESDFGRAFHQARLNVPSSPVGRPFQNKTALVGQTAVFVCPVAGYPPVTFCMGESAVCRFCCQSESTFQSVFQIDPGLQNGRSGNDYALSFATGFPCSELCQSIGVIHGVLLSILDRRCLP